MKNALILHGTAGSPEKNWFRWLEKELQERGWKAWVPQLPQAETPNIQRYNDFLFSSGWEFNSESVVIGHSAGAVAILGLLEELPEGVVIDHAILVAAFRGDLGWDSLKELAAKPLDFEKIKKHARKITFIHSDDDPYCPLEHAQYLAEKVNGELIVKPGSKHFSIDTGGERFKELPEALEILERN